MHSYFVYSESPVIRVGSGGGFGMLPIVTEIAMVYNTYHLACPLDTNIRT
jgi:hypothetical protein